MLAEALVLNGTVTRVEKNIENELKRYFCLRNHLYFHEQHVSRNLTTKDSLDQALGMSKK